MTDPELGDYDWFCEVLQARRGTAQSWVSRGQVPGVIKIGRVVRFNKAVVREWIASRTVVVDELRARRGAEVAR